MSSTNIPSVTENDTHINNDSQGNSSDRKIIRVGSRKSELALVQTNHVISMLQKFYPSQKFEIHKMSTMGDRVLNVSLPKIGEKSLFTKDLEEALKNGMVDFVVHSLKDLPTALPEGMLIGAVLEREDPRDSLVLSKKHEGKSLKSLPEGSIIGTSSLRRIAQISRLHPHLRVHDIRGNLNTRLGKLDAVDSKYAGIVLAQAGLVRLGWQNRVNQTIDPNEMMYAVGQGALAVECRASDKKVLQMLQTLVCHETQCRILAERSFLKTLGGGCSAPVAVHSTLIEKNHTNASDTTGLNEFELRIRGSVWSLDGKTEIQAESTCDLKINGKNHSAIEEQSSGEEGEAVPLKRMKFQMENDKLSFPEILDHSQLPVESDNNLNQIAETDSRNVQSNTCKKCPYSSLISTTNKLPEMEAKSNVYGNSSSKCPLNFSIGQDVMGQCPYFEIAESNQMHLKSVNSSDDCTNINEIDYIKKNLSCPYIYKASSSNLDNANESFTSKQNLNTTNTEDSEVSKSEHVVEPLFCGIYPHRCWSIKVFEQCERLGKSLASMLIQKGALTVMEAAQNEIRNKI